MIHFLQKIIMALPLKLQKLIQTDPSVILGGAFYILIEKNIQDLILGRMEDFRLLTNLDTLGNR